MAWFDGQQVLNKRDIRWRYRPGFKITQAYLTTYVGGSDPRRFAPKQDQFIWYALAVFLQLFGPRAKYSSTCTTCELSTCRDPSDHRDHSTWRSTWRFLEHKL